MTKVQKFLVATAAMAALAVALMPSMVIAGGAYCPPQPFNPGNPPQLPCDPNTKHPNWICQVSSGLCLPGTPEDWCTQDCNPHGVWPPSTVRCKGNNTGGW